MVSRSFAVTKSIMPPRRTAPAGRPRSAAGLAVSLLAVGGAARRDGGLGDERDRRSSARSAISSSDTRPSTRRSSPCRNSAGPSTATAPPAVTALGVAARGRRRTSVRPARRPVPTAPAPSCTGCRASRGHERLDEHADAGRAEEDQHRRQRRRSRGRGRSSIGVAPRSLQVATTAGSMMSSSGCGSTPSTRISTTTALITSITAAWCRSRTAVAAERDQQAVATDRLPRARSCCTGLGTLGQAPTPRVGPCVVRWIIHST